MRAFAARISRFLFIPFLIATGSAYGANADGDDPALQLRTVAVADSAVPRDVPAGYVITPAGYFHPSCVRHVRAGEVVDMASGAIVDARGTATQAASICEYPRFTASCERIDTTVSARLHPSDGVDSVGNQTNDNGISLPGDTVFANGFDKYTGWIESVWAHPTPTAAISFQQVDFSVPAAPVNTAVSTNFFFPGAQSLDQTPQHGTIIQPVLGWNGYSNLHAWTIASWNCCVDGNVNASDYVTVQTGHAIRGKVQGTGCVAATGVCANWKIVTTDVTTGQSVTLDSTAYGQAFNWVFAGALEVYDVASCNDISPSGHMDFTGIVTRNVAGQNVALDYYTDTPSSSVWCGFGTYTLTDHTAYRLTF